MDYRICPKCGTQNEPSYMFCKNCGTPLVTSAEPHTSPSADPNAVGPAVDGIPSEEAAAFIGKKANRILHKFWLMDLRQSRVCWCWPVALLGYFLGPIGAAVWFFYRKLYKPALLFLAIGLIASAAVTVMAGPQTEATLSEGSLIAALERAALDPSAGGDFGSLLREANPRLVAADVIQSLVSLTTAIVTGLFGLVWYRREMVSRIFRYRATNADPRYYGMGLAAIGGTSGALAAVGILAFTFAETYLSTLLRLIL